MRQFQEYAEPDETTEDRRRSGIKDEDKVLLPLDENVLTDNLGLPMVVVVTKVFIVLHQGLLLQEHSIKSCANF